jgi:1,4-dihydroxy-6-naphthoate synthase
MEDAVNYAMQYARGQPKETMTEFVKMYVNDLTLDMGTRGKRAIERMFGLAREKKLIEREILVEVV